MKKQINQIQIAACAFDLKGGNLPTEIQLTPAGEFRARDGRPGKGKSWVINAELAAAIIAKMSAIEGDFVIDYEHQTIHAPENGKPAPAAGWFSGKDIVWREGKGLFATNVTWTDLAAQQVKDLQYRYISPVMAFDKKTGEVRNIFMASLTNFPAIEGLSDLTEMAAAKFNLPNETSTEDSTVNRDELIALCGLLPEATDGQIKAALKAMSLAAIAAGDLETEKVSLTSEIEALKANGGKEPDPAKYVPVSVVTALQGQVADLVKKSNDTEVEDLVTAALASGKLLPATEKWARDLGESDIESLKSFLETAPAIAALTNQQTKKTVKLEDIVLSKDELATCKSMDLDIEEFKKTKAEMAA